MAEQAKFPFAAGTRLRRQYVGSVAYVSGGKASIAMPRVGMLSRLSAIFEGAVTFSAPGAMVDLGPHNIINRFQLNTNIGTTAVIDVSGYGAYVSSAHQRFGYKNTLAGVGATTPSTTMYTAPLNTGTVRIPYQFNVAVNQGQNFTDGMINLQAPEISVSLDLQFGVALTDYATLITALTGNVYVYYEYFEIPDPTAFEMPRLVLHRTLEEQTPIGQTGANIYTVPRSGTLLSLDSIIRLNGARSDSWDSYAVRFNKTDSVYQVDQRWSRLDDRFWLGIEPETGVIRQDFFHAQETINTGTSRDAIDTEQLTTLENIINISAGATLGSNNNSMAHVRRIVQVLD